MTKKYSYIYFFIILSLLFPFGLFAQERILDSKRISTEEAELFSAAVDNNGKLIAAFYDSSNDLKLWVDDGNGGATAGDRIVSTTEVRDIENGNALAGGTAIAVNQDNQIIIVYNLNGGTLKIWIDDGAGGGAAGDYIATAGEIRDIDTDGENPALTFDSNDQLVVSYYDSASADLNVWIDDGLGGGTAGDAIVTGGEIRTIEAAGSVGLYSSIVVDGNNHLAVSFHSITDDAVKVWIDDGAGAGTPANGEVDGTEVRVIETGGTVGAYTSIFLDVNNRLAVSLTDTANTELKLWVDDGFTGGSAGDGVVNGSELRTIDTTVGTFAGSRVGRNENNRLVVAYTESGTDLIVWIDDASGGGTAGDAIVNGAEIRAVVTGGNIAYVPSVLLALGGDLAVVYYNTYLSIYAVEGYTAQNLITTGDVGDYTSIAYDTSQHLAISYVDQTNSQVRLWYDDGASGGTAGDRLASNGEIRTIASGSTFARTELAREPNGTKFALSYINQTNSTVYVWVDDGAGGGTADDEIATAGEIRTVASGTVGLNLSMIFDGNDHLAIAFTQNSDLKLWVDDGTGGGGAGDYVVDAGEIRIIDGNNLGHYASLAEVNGKLGISYLDDNRQNAFLWYDNGAGGGVDDDGQATAGEILTVEANLVSAHYTAFGSIGGELAVSYVRPNPGRALKLWIDDGNGGGNSSNEAVEAGEIRVVESGVEPSTTALAMTTDSFGRAAITYINGSTPKFWLDDGAGNGTAGDRLATAGELRTVGSPLLSGSASGRSIVSIERGDSNDERLVIALRGIGGGTTSNDLVMFSLTPVAPEINVTGDSTNIDSGDSTASGSDHTDFGSTNVNGGTVVRTFTIQNLGNDNLILTGTPRVALSGADAASFSVTAQPVTPIAAAGSQTFSVTFDPSASGVKNATVSIDNNDSNENPYTFAIAGTGAAPEIAVSGNSVNIANGDVTPSTTDHTDFGSVAISGGIVNRTFTIANTGGVNLVLSGTPRAALSGAGAAHFSVTAQPSTPVASSGSTTFVVRYDPSATGAHAATVTIANDDSDENPFTFAIAGSAVEPEIDVKGNNVNIVSGDVTPSSADHTDFGTANVSGGFVNRTFTIGNTGGASLVLSGNPKAAVSGAGAAHFSVTTQPTTPVASSGSTTFIVKYDPSASGAHSATISIANDDSDENPFTFAISGTAVEPEINVKGNSIDIASGDTTPSTADHTDFGNVDATSGTLSRTFTIQNTGAGSLTLSGTPKVSLSGSGVADFSVTTQPTSPVAASGSTTFTILFNPTSAGEKTVAVSITNDDSSENPYTFSVKGTGTSTNQTPSDSDGDGVSDEQEAIDGTNPNDGGSALEVLPTSWCSEWNGFFGMYNINEYANKDSSKHTISTRLFNIDGTASGDADFSIPKRSQLDVLVHALAGWSTSSYGQVCTAVGNAEPGDIDGRAVLYSPNKSGGFDFAYATPFSAGTMGRLFVTFNNYQPSSDPADSNNELANWLQLVNATDSTQSGKILYYAANGSLIESEGITLEPRGRRDFSAHRLGRNISGLVEWRPAKESANFTFRNVRYYYDNPQGSNSFDSALQIEARRGSGELQGVVLDASANTAVLEVANVKNAEVTTTIKFYSKAGTLRETQTITLPPYGSRHIVANAILKNSLGSATVKGNAAGSIIAVAMHYGRTASQGISTVYGVTAKEAIGTTFRGSYNTFLGQECEVLISNTSSSQVTALVSMTRLDSTEILEDEALTIPAKGTVAYDACSNEEANQYGTITVVASSPSKIVPTMIRIGQNSSYIFPVTMR